MTDDGGLLLGGDAMNWASLVKALLYIWAPTAIITLGVLPHMGINFFVMPNPGAWLIVVFFAYLGWKADKLFPTKKG